MRVQKSDAPNDVTQLQRNSHAEKTQISIRLSFSGTNALVMPNGYSLYCKDSAKKQLIWIPFKKGETQGSESSNKTHKKEK